MKDEKTLILDIVKDLVSSFTYYDRKEDEDLSPEELEECIKKGVISIDEIVAQFKEELEESYK